MKVVPATLGLLGPVSAVDVSRRCALRTVDGTWSVLEPAFDKLPWKSNSIFIVEYILFVVEGRFLEALWEIGNLVVVEENDVG